MKAIKQISFTILDIILFVLTIFAVFLAFKNPFTENIDYYINYSFLAILLIQFLISNNKKTYIKNNIWDVMVIALLAMPILRVFRLFRFFRVVRSGMFFKKVNFKNIKDVLKLTKDNISLNLAFVFSVVFFFAGLEYWAEYSVNSAQFTSYKDAVWWAFATITSVGYGDVAPVTDLGRTIAVMLMFVGFVVYGILISNLTAWLMEKE